jgi:hypothetical protein
LQSCVQAGAFASTNRILASRATPFDRRSTLPALIEGNSACLVVS